VWRGRLSSSPLATAVALAALDLAAPGRYRSAVERARIWLERAANPDGGYGDAFGAPSNVSATLLVWAALQRCASNSPARAAAEQWLFRRGLDLSQSGWMDEVLRYYGEDRTFSVPILVLCAACAPAEEAGEIWRRIPQLPHELGLLSHRWLGRLRIPVVSYALPALVAMGVARVLHAEPTSFRAWLARRWESRWTQRLAELQPRHGGYLDAIPLTAFVTVALVAAGLEGSETVRRALHFLAETQREDGSWPIDRDLAVWITAGMWASIAVLDPTGEWMSQPVRTRATEWLLAQQTQGVHPFTGSPPGGWPWTDAGGGVPDADDTSAALLVLHALAANDPCAQQSAARGIAWLLQVQNRDGGIPTFCRGWGRLPFDRSCPDLTAHALRAFRAWAPRLDPELQRKVVRAVWRAVKFLLRSQQPDGSWIPLWFGNPRAPDETNRTIGTGLVLSGLAAWTPMDARSVSAAIENGRRYLEATQGEDGGWGAMSGSPATVEETAAAVQGLAAAGMAHSPALARGLTWLAERWAGGGIEPAPIGLYFARLWYYEDLYPTMFTLRALAAIAAARER